MKMVRSTQVGSFCEGLWYLEGGPDVAKLPFEQERKFFYSSGLHTYDFPDFYAFLRAEA